MQASRRIAVYSLAMLIRRAQLDEIVAGRISLAFRRWKTPTVKSGGTLRTAVGVLAIDAVDVVALASITARDAKAAGYPSLSALVEHLNSRDDGVIYRVRLRYAGSDPRIALRESGSLSADDLSALTAKLDRLDANSRHGAWTRQALNAIRANPGLYSGVLATQLGFERLWLKAQIRKLKELGLTESLEVGYRLSARGEALLSAGA